jgi:prepilin-type N-terminal cleavage/methylation domain-containing protein/prepilin-type processing-associated H-X9-DG protein
LSVLHDLQKQMPFYNCCYPKNCVFSRAFTLIELLVVLAMVALLASLLLPVLSQALAKARSTQCFGQLRQIGLSTVMFADDNGGCLPRSTHSAVAHGELPWGYALYPYLTGRPFTQPDERWTNLLDTLYRCPTQKRLRNEWSYGKNVYPELSPEETGGQTWSHLSDLPRPSAVVLYAEKAGGSMADHIMANYWAEGGQPEVDRHRHLHKSNYSFCDGHVSNLRFDQTYDLERTIDNWNPATAR